LACGYGSTSCGLLLRTEASAYECNPTNYDLGEYALCQIGDLSGKFGNAFPDVVNGNIFTQSTVLTDYQPPIAANHLQSNGIAELWSSVVFHSSTGRLVCAKFELIADSDCETSICHFPKLNAQLKPLPKPESDPKQPKKGPKRV
jgi:hypothetical protein